MPSSGPAHVAGTRRRAANNRPELRDPNVIVAGHIDAQHTLQLLHALDPARPWHVLQWQPINGGECQLAVIGP